MKKFKTISIAALISVMFMFACHDVLDHTPRDRFSETIVWTDIELADNYLFDIYHSLRSGMREMMLSAVTDETFFIHIYGSDIYVQGNISAGNTGPWGENWRYEHTAWWLFNAVQKSNVFLANIENVLEGTEGFERGQLEERVSTMRGEAKFIRAYAYTQMARSYGGLPIITEPFELGDDFSDFGRATFEETVDFISEQADLAAGLLGSKAEMELGRATEGAALALKSRIWLFAASDLTADGNAESEYVGYGAPDRDYLWQRARDAAADVMALGAYELADFGAPDHESVAEGYYDFFRQQDLTHNEIIWGKMFSQDAGATQQMNLWNGPNGLACWGGNNPTQNLIDSYQMVDGTDFFEHFEINANGYYQNISVIFNDDNPYLNRDPRFYGSILYDQAEWAPAGSTEYGYPGYYDRRTRRVIEGGNVVSEVHGLDTRQGPTSPHNAGYTGYLMKKMQDHEIHCRNDNNTNVWIEFRFAEIILNYAEALIGLGQTAEAAEHINMIRNRSGMPDFSGDITEALRYERQIEFTFEDKRWYDIRRWRILEETLTPAMGIDIVETTTDGDIETVWRQTHIQDRAVNSRMYWIPISSEELNRAPQLVQNPGY